MHFDAHGKRSAEAPTLFQASLRKRLVEEAVPRHSLSHLIEPASMPDAAEHKEARYARVPRLCCKCLMPEP